MKNLQLTAAALIKAADVGGKPNLSIKPPEPISPLTPTPGNPQPAAGISGQPAGVAQGFPKGPMSLNNGQDGTEQILAQQQEQEAQQAAEEEKTKQQKELQAARDEVAQTKAQHSEILSQVHQAKAEAATHKSQVEQHKAHAKLLEEAHKIKSDVISQREKALQDHLGMIEKTRKLESAPTFLSEHAKRIAQKVEKLGGNTKLAYVAFTKMAGPFPTSSTPTGKAPSSPMTKSAPPPSAPPAASSLTPPAPGQPPGNLPTAKAATGPLQTGSLQGAHLQPSPGMSTGSMSAVHTPNMSAGSAGVPMTHDQQQGAYKDYRAGVEARYGNGTPGTVRYGNEPLAASGRIITEQGDRTAEFAQPSAPTQVAAAKPPAAGQSPGPFDGSVSLGVNGGTTPQTPAPAAAPVTPAGVTPAAQVAGAAPATPGGVTTGQGSFAPVSMGLGGNTPSTQPPDGGAAPAGTPAVDPARAATQARLAATQTPNVQTTTSGHAGAAIRNAIGTGVSATGDFLSDSAKSVANNTIIPAGNMVGDFVTGLGGGVNQHDSPYNYAQASAPTVATPTSTVQPNPTARMMRNTAGSAAAGYSGTQPAGQTARPAPAVSGQPTASGWGSQFNSVNDMSKIKAAAAILFPEIMIKAADIPGVPESPIPSAATHTPLVPNSPLPPEAHNVPAPAATPPPPSAVPATSGAPRQFANKHEMIAAIPNMTPQEKSMQMQRLKGEGAAALTRQNQAASDWDNSLRGKITGGVEDYINSDPESYQNRKGFGGGEHWWNQGLDAVNQGTRDTVRNTWLGGKDWGEGNYGSGLAHFGRMGASVGNTMLMGGGGGSTLGGMAKLLGKGMVMDGGSNLLERGIGALTPEQMQASDIDAAPGTRPYMVGDRHLTKAQDLEHEGQNPYWNQGDTPQESLTGDPGSTTLAQRLQLSGYPNRNQISNPGDYDKLTQFSNPWAQMGVNMLGPMFYPGVSQPNMGGAAPTFDPWGRMREAGNMLAANPYMRSGY